MLYIKKRSMCQTFGLYIFITSFLLNFLQEFLHIPGIIKYTIDIAWVTILLFMILTRKKFIYKKTTPIWCFLVCYILYVSIVYLFQYQSIYYFLWGMRNNIRYYIAFLAFIYFFDKDDVDFCLKFIDVLFVIHVAVSFFQFFVLGYKWDYLGGIFGVQLGCNANSLILLIIACVKALLMYMHGKGRLISTMAICCFSLVISVMAELKFFFVIFLIILVLSALITKFSWKKILLIFGVSLLVFFAINLFTAVWGEKLALSFDRIIELITSSNYSSARDLGRLTAIPTISETILIDTPQKLFGLGLGNCDTSQFSAFNSPFFQSHAYLNYNWFSSAFSFIETGYIGLIISISFFVIVGVVVRNNRKDDNCNKLYSDMSMILCVTCIALFFYNSSLRTDIAYIVYFVLALPLISTSSKSVFQLYS